MVQRYSRSWLHKFVKLGKRSKQEGVPNEQIRRQEETVVHALQMLKDRPGVVLADDVGMGKTYEAMGIIAVIRRTRPNSRIVVLTPGEDLNNKWRKTFDSGIVNFGNEMIVATTVVDFVEACKTHSIVIAPYSLFSGIYWHSYILSLYARWKRLRYKTRRAAFRAVHARKVDVNGELFLSAFPRRRLDRHLGPAFSELEDLYSKGTLSNRRQLRHALHHATLTLVRELLRSQIDLLVVDEAHKLKNSESIRATAVSTVFKNRFRNALFLTATPFELDVDDLNFIFELFSEATHPAANKVVGYGKDLLREVRNYQEAYTKFEDVWRGIDLQLAQDFRRYYERNPDLSRMASGDPNLKIICERANDLLTAKQKVEPELRRWMIRSLRTDRQAYRRSNARKLQPKYAEGVLFLIYERFLRELFWNNDRTHKASVDLNMTSSYGAARKGSLLIKGGRQLPRDCERYRNLLRSVLGGSSLHHEKVTNVAQDSIEAARDSWEKTVIFCARSETIYELTKEIKTEWERCLLKDWKKIFPELSPVQIFGSKRRGAPGALHMNLQRRFHSPRDALYLALREPYFTTLCTLSQPTPENLTNIVRSANEKLETIRVSANSSTKPNYRLIKRCVEQAACKLLRPELGKSFQGAILDPRYPTLGLALKWDKQQSEKEGTTKPLWRISDEEAKLVFQSNLWTFALKGYDKLDREMRVRLCESIARFLTLKECPFLPDFLAYAKENGAELTRLRSHELTQYLVRFWASDESARWRGIISEFLHYFRNLPAREQAALLRGPLRTGQVVAQTRDSENERRTRLIEAFNTPLFPLILVANEVMQEGIDLHKHCRRIIHHDLLWNPAKLEQRVGRIDRLGSFIEALRANGQGDEKLDVISPQILQTIDTRMYSTVMRRDKWLQFLLGSAPKSFDSVEDEASGPELPPGFSNALRINLEPAAPRQ